MSRNLWNRSVFRVHLYATTPSFTIRASRQMLQYWQPVLCASLRPWRTGCRPTGSDWTQTRRSSSGSEQATSWTFFSSIPYPQNEVVNNLGVYFDPELLMERQVNKLCQVLLLSSAMFENGRRSLTKESLLTLVHAFVTSRVDHCNGVLYGSNGYLLDRLQSVLNSAARLILGVPKFDSVSAAIRDELH